MITKYKFGEPFETEAVVENVASSSVIGLRLTMTVIPIVGLLIGIFWFYKKYHLTEEKLEEIRSQLEQK